MSKPVLFVAAVACCAYSADFSCRSWLCALNVSGAHAALVIRSCRVVRWLALVGDCTGASPGGAYSDADIVRGRDETGLKLQPCFSMVLKPTLACLLSICHVFRCNLCCPLGQRRRLKRAVWRCAPCLTRWSQGSRSVAHLSRSGLLPW